MKIAACSGLVFISEIEAHCLASMKPPGDPSFAIHHFPPPHR
ncbi:hypothetical protein OpiT1DRAFT_04107 [Opitutaceae bacterium TAV1]|nr:hypothetical protein OpiT1DRAFT_04107 [Opitutaceae bacterium TAV1]